MIYLTSVAVEIKLFCCLLMAYGLVGGTYMTTCERKHIGRDDRAVPFLSIDQIAFESDRATSRLFSPS
jgi:hypothetical protein